MEIATIPGHMLGSPDSKCFGLLVRGMDKDELVKWLYAYTKEHGLPLEKPELSITLPCGETIDYGKFVDIPDHDVPCPCGDPDHFMIKYEPQTC